MGFLVLTLCVPMNTVFAEGTNGHSKEVQSISLQEDSQKEEKSENENLQVPTESVTGENIDDSGNVDFPQEPEVPSSEWTSGWNFYEGNWTRVGLFPWSRREYIIFWLDLSEFKMVLS